MAAGADFPQSLDEFRVLARLGSGSTGDVFDVRWGPRRVALKVAHDAAIAGDAAERFRVEGDLLASIGHEAVVKLLGRGQLSDGRPYLIMERLEGETLARRVGRGPVPPAEADQFFAQIAGAVQELHARGLVHRDLKAENVFIAGEHAVLLDLGIVESVDKLVASSRVLGTPATMAPERAAGQPASMASDIYELALLYYVLRCGRLPWDEGDPVGRLSPARMRSLGAEVAEAIEDTIARALDPRPNERPNTVAALCEGLGIDPEKPQPVSESAASPEPEAADAPGPEVARTGTAESEPDPRRERRRRIVELTLRVAALIAAVICAAEGIRFIALEADKPLDLSPAMVRRRLCDLGSASACASLGEMFEDGTDTFRDDHFAMAFYRRACELDRSYGCGPLGFLLYERRQRGGDLSEAAHFLELGCDGGDAAACARLARMRDGGEGVERDEAEAAKFYRRACRQGDGSSCVNLGFAYSQGEGVEKDLARAAALYREGCEKKAAIGCFNLGYVHRHGLGVESDLARAVELYDQACEMASGSACANLGEMYGRGTGLPVDEAKAAELYQRGCDLGSAVGCGNLAVLADRGQGVAEDPERAREFYRRACELSEGRFGCNNLGNLYAEGRGGATDEVIARELYRRACDAGVGMACANLARRLARSSEPPSAEILEAYRRGCELGDERSCHEWEVVAPRPAVTDSGLPRTVDAGP